MQVPGDLMRLPDGRILLTYGVRNEGFWSICVRFADATARTWSPAMCLVDLDGSTEEPRSLDPLRDGGYPSTVALAWLLANPAVTAPIIWPRTVKQLEDSIRATEVTLDAETLKQLDEIFPGPGGVAPNAYAW